MPGRTWVARQPLSLRPPRHSHHTDQVGRLLHARTQLTAVSSVTGAGAATLPAPYALTAAELSATRSPDQPELVEGMLG